MAKKSRKTNADGETPVTVESGKSLVIVESPAKAKTINKYLGTGYVVRASKGHVRDLPPHRYGVDPGRNFEPTYEILPSHQKTISELQKLAREADVVYLATDLDREGEAIAWHLAQALDLPAKKIRRVVFNEITKSAIKEAFSHPHEIDQAKVDAQQARRILDRVVGYELSPLLWKKVAKGLSAGRVQSVAVRLVVNREREIAAYEPQEYWSVSGVFTGEGAKIEALSKEWAAFLRGGGAERKDAEGEEGEESTGTGRTMKERAGWLGEHGCFSAELIEIKGAAAKFEGRLEEGNGKGKGKRFISAVEDVRPIVEALGFKVESVRADAWAQYERLGLQQIEFVGRFDPSAAPTFSVKSIEKKRSKSKPPAPFTTASLQQAAANQLHFATSKTMKVAQALYEGIDIKTGEGNVGLITYMRTDSTNLSAESVQHAREYIAQKFGDIYVPDRPNIYSSKKTAQEAHEAIRPTDVTRTPESLRGHMTSEQHRLYTLIWNRFVACQMTAAEWDSTTVLLTAKTKVGDATFKASGRVLAFDGFYKVLGVPKSSEDQLLPELAEGQRTPAVAIEAKQRFTAPPPRYTEASLVKTLEAEGIGRPSTYAAIIKTIQDRGYVEQEDRKFHPTPRGIVVTDKLCEHFPKIMDVRFTSHIEEDLDKIEEREMEWHDVLHEFYDPFKESLARAHEEMDAVRAEPSEYTCGTCGKPMVYRLGKNGRFLSCTGYPECKETRNVDRDGKPIEPVVGAEPCELCGKPMVMRKSRSGVFLGCTGYPECSNTRPCDDSGVALKKVRAEEIDEKCPDCGAAMGVRWARGRAFLGCTKYPDCKATKPMPEGVYVEKPKPEDAGARCDKCGRAMVIRKSRRGPFLSCSGFPRCRNAMPMEKLDELKRKESAGEIPDAPAENGGTNGRARTSKPRGAGGKVKRLTKDEVKALGAPPPGFAWTLTGRPVVETWPEEPLTCFECGSEMTLRQGRFGPFYSCGKCKAVANLRGEAKKRAEAESPQEARAKPIETDVKCPDCGSKMLLRMGRTGRFLGCSAYPKCKKTMEAPAGLLREVAVS